MEVDLLVIHAISLPPGCFGGGAIDALFLGHLGQPDHPLAASHPFLQEIAQLRVSAHFLIDRAGCITQYVPILARAWHAGVSNWQGRDACNDFSVGIELEGDEQTPFTPAQYDTLSLLIQALRRRLPSLCSVAGHQHVAPGRKWDPGRQFDWERLRIDLADVQTERPEVNALVCAIV